MYVKFVDAYGQEYTVRETEVLDMVNRVAYQSLPESCRDSFIEYNMIDWIDGWASYIEGKTYRLTQVNGQTSGFFNQFIAHRLSQSFFRLKLNDNDISIVSDALKEVSQHRLDQAIILHNELLYYSQSYALEKGVLLDE